MLAQQFDGVGHGLVTAHGDHRGVSPERAADRPTRAGCVKRERNPFSRIQSSL